MVEKVRLKVDHTYLNDIEGLEHPSLENVARWIWNQLASDLEGLDRVTVRRGPDGLAEGCTYSGRPGIEGGNRAEYTT